MKTVFSSILTAAAIAFAGTSSAAIVSSTPQTFTTNNDNVATYTLDKTYSGNVWVDFSLSYDGVLDNNAFTALWFGASSGPNFGLKANCGNGSCSNDVFGRTNGSNGSFIPGSNLLEDTTYQIVGYLQKINGSANYNKIDIWFFQQSGPVNLAGLGTAQASFSANSNISAFNTLGFRTANLSGDSVTIDDLRITAVPEPTSLALLALAAAGMGVAARRKKE